MGEKKLETIRKQVTDGIYISRVPKLVKREFIELANSEEFGGDYGFCLKWLMDFRKGLLSSPNQLIAEQIEVLTQEVEEVKSMLNVKEKEKPKKKVIKSVSGKVIAEKKEGD